MRKMFQYRIYPTQKQVHKLNETLEECRWLYNHLLEKRKETYQHTGKGLSLYQQQETFPRLKQERPSLERVHSQVLQNVAVRVDLAMKAFFRRCKEQVQEPAFPRFKGKGRYDSFTFPQSGFSLTHENHVCLSKIGSLKLVYHRPIQGKIKTATIHRSSTGKWYVSFSVECDPERRKHRKVVARVHERIGWRRENFTHQHSRKVVDRFGVICVEDLAVNRMIHNHCLAKSIADASWAAFFDQLSSKAEEAGRAFVKVNPAYTSQTCSRCGHRQKMPLDVSIFDCPCCHVQLDRDLNASINIRGLGLQALGLSVEAPVFRLGE